MKKFTALLLIVLLLTCGLVLLGCSNTSYDNVPAKTPEDALEGYWSTTVSGITISYKFENGSYYGKFSAIVNGNNIDSGFSYWGSYKVIENESRIELVDTDGDASQMRYVFSNESITYLATIAKNGSDGAVLVKASDLIK